MASRRTIDDPAPRSSAPYDTSRHPDQIRVAAPSTLRQRIEHLPTWPWPPQLLRGFVSALLLPLLIYVLTRVLANFV